MKRILLMLCLFCFAGCTFTSATMAQELDSKEDFRFIVLPDTQYYSEKYPDIFQTQITYALENNPAFVLHVGDLVQNGWIHEEWEIAQSMMGQLDYNISYGIAIGNHDYHKLKGSNNGDYTKTEFFNYFDVLNRFEHSYWDVFYADEKEYLILFLEINPPVPVLEWADTVIKAHHNLSTIIVTHINLKTNGRRDYTKYRTDREVYSSGDAVKELIKNCNVELVLSGHHHGTSRKLSQNACGDIVHEVLQDYQDSGEGGDGWLREYYVYLEDERMEIKTYSPYLEKYKVDESNEFTLLW